MFKLHPLEPTLPPGEELGRLRPSSGVRLSGTRQTVAVVTQLESYHSMRTTRGSRFVKCVWSHRNTFTLIVQELGLRQFPSRWYFREDTLLYSPPENFLAAQDEPFS